MPVKAGNLNGIDIKFFSEALKKDLKINNFGVLVGAMGHGPMCTAYINFKNMSRGAVDNLKL